MLNDLTDEPISDLAADLARWRLALDRGTFEETYLALESVVARLERGQMRLDESVACYELGVFLAKRCGRILDDAELRITRLDESQNREPDLEPDDHFFADEFDDDIE